MKRLLKQLEIAEVPDRDPLHALGRTFPGEAADSRSNCVQWILDDSTFDLKDVKFAPLEKLKWKRILSDSHSYPSTMELPLF